ncbi:hypothetical protein [Arenibaculum pallidiluteum]|uniref:hypothetical protein n=1 Tax=Arenibaculum pallidiluteum TaxID=2812559 RepID=UPI001A966D1E|nr:hypothetical protein [Arenibaculum pallidiluteum]
MRAYSGQRSDNAVIKRSFKEKEQQLRQLRDQLAGLKSHVSPALRESIQKKIAELEADLGRSPRGRD